MKDFPLEMMIFMELFVSIHMSVFVLFPLASLINKGKKMQIFCILFVLRVVILVIGDITIGGAMAIIDFFSVFLGAFILVPVATGIKHSITGGQTTFREYNEASEIELLNHGIEDGHLLEQKLIKQYQDIENAKTNKDKVKLKKLCTERQYNEFVSNIDLYNEVNQTRYTSINNIIESKLVEIYDSNTTTSIEIVLKVDITSYVEDNNGKVVDGNKLNSKETIYKLKFIKKLAKNTTVTNRRCDGCGAPINETDSCCPYCNLNTGHEIENKNWLLDDIKTIKK